MKLNTTGQIKKLNEISKLAKDASSSKDVIKKLGSLVVYSGLVDFLVIQAARIFEQIILKYQLSKKGKPSFEPKDDS